MTTKNIEQKPQPPQWVLSLINTEDTTEMLEIVNNQFPNWITHVSDGYHFKYNMLNRNWSDICNSHNHVYGIIKVVEYAQTVLEII